MVHRACSCPGPCGYLRDARKVLLFRYLWCSEVRSRRRGRGLRHQKHQEDELTTERRKFRLSTLYSYILLS